MSDQEQAETAADAEDASVETTDEEPESTGLGDGDFVRLAYTIRTADDGEVIDTTDEETAAEAAIDTDEYEFEPRIVTLGAGHVFPSVETALEGEEPGDTGTVDVPAADAFGEDDPEDVEPGPADQIDDDDKYHGARLTNDGRQGRPEPNLGRRGRS